jgi:hypothetical protein
MNVTLPKELEEFVLEKAATGEYATADAVVVEALLESSKARWTKQVNPPGCVRCPPELKTMLLEALHGPHDPMPPDYLDQLRETLRSPGAR